MSKPVRIKVVDKSQPDMRKLARALLQLVEQQSSEHSVKPRVRKAS